MKEGIIPYVKQELSDLGIISQIALLYGKLNFPGDYDREEIEMQIEALEEKLDRED